MAQRNLFSYFSQKPATTPLSSPITKKQTAIRTLAKISKKVEEEEFELDMSETSSEDEHTFKKLLTEEKIMKMNAKKKDVSSSSSESETNFVEDEEEKPKKKAKPAAPKSKAAKTRTMKSSKSSVEFDAPIEVNHAEIAKEASASVTEEDLPDWLSTKLRDAKNRSPGQEGYDPTTIMIPISAEEKFTPFQKQFWRIKKDNFDSIVMIRKGKFFEMFSVDAIFARDVLKLHLTWRGKEPMCGVPEKAFSEWALKIVNAGKKVCKVEQMETAVDLKNKKGGDKAITRELVQVYSIGTIDDFEMLESSQPSYLLSIRSSSRELAGVCLIDCSTGTFHLGSVTEQDLADTLIRFEPVEVVYHASSICQEHLDIIKHYCGSVASKAKSSSDNWDGQLAKNSIQRIAGWEDFPEILSSFPPDSIAALGGCVAYLNEHKIAKSLLSLQKFMRLDEIGNNLHLSLDSSALANLNVIGKDERCLLNVIDHCQTPFGKRRLRFWVMHPLQNKTIINERLDAVEELMGKNFINVAKKMKSLPDLERILSRVYSNRCSVRIFLDCLDALRNAAKFCASLEEIVQSKMLKTCLPSNKAKSALKKLDEISSELEIQKSLDSNEFIVKTGVFEDIDAIDVEISSIEGEFNDILRNIKKEIGVKDAEFVNMQSERYQVQIPARFANDLPSDYILMSKTKTVHRYHTKEIKELLGKLEKVENDRQKLRSGSQKRFIDDFAKYSYFWDFLVESISEIDCLFSLAQTCSGWQARTICRPHFVDFAEVGNHACLDLKQMRHPCLSGTVIPNDVKISDKFVLLITGPNTSGKSTYARMCCLAIILAQIGCFLPAEQATLTVYSQIFTRIGASDRLFSGQSTFGVESAETARLMNYAKPDSFVVLDELGRGTSTLDGIAIASAVLEYFLNTVKCPLVFCTHYHVLAENYNNRPEVRNASMRYEIKERLILAYTLVDGMCSSSFGCKVAELCGLPADLTKEAQKVADEFEDRHASLRTTGESVDIKEKPANPACVEMKKKIEALLEIKSDIKLNSKFEKLHAEIQKLEI